MALKKFLSSQKAYLAQLTKGERALLYSFFLFGFASPIFHVFTNTFLWRNSADPTTVIIYNVGLYLGLSFGFLANAFLLRVIPARRLYLLACVLQGIVPIVLVTLAPHAHDLVLLLGFSSGVSGGMYWANRNYFTSLITKNTQRFSFLTLEQFFTTLASIIAPIAIGWFIAFGDRADSYGTGTAYLTSVVIGLVLFACSGFVAQKVLTASARQKSKALFLRDASPRWNALRGMDFFNGLMNGMDMTVPFLAVLTIVGMEDAVGTLQTISAAAAAVAVYIAGKKYATTPQSVVLRVWFIVVSLAGLAVTVHFSPWTVVFYTVVFGLFSPLRGAAIANILYKTIDHEAGNDRSRYLFDREMFLNFGRVTSLVLLAFCAWHWPDVTIRLGFTAVILVRALFVFSASTVEAANATK